MWISWIYPTWDFYNSCLSLNLGIFWLLFCQVSWFFCLLNLNLSFSREKAMAPPPVLLPGKSHGRRSLEGCSPWGREESDTTERLHFRFSLSCIGEGNGNPLQYSCLENPRDGGAWWAAVYGVAQSRTRLKWLSSSSSREIFNLVIVFSPEFVSFPCYNFSLLIISRCLYIIF